MLMLVVGIPASASAATPVRTCILPATGNETPRALFARPTRFDCTAKQSDFGAGDYWLLSQPLPSTVGGDAQIRQQSLWQDSATIHVLYADGAVRRTSFTSATAWRHLHRGAIVQLALPPHGARPVRLLWHIRGSLNRYGILKGATLASPSEAVAGEIERTAFYAAFTGLFAALFVYNLALWAALRQSFQAAYSLMVLCMLGYGLAASGVLGMVLRIDNNDRQRMVYVLLAWFAASATVFARALLERRVFDGWLRPYSNGVVGLLLASSTGYVVLAPRFAVFCDTLTRIAYVLVLTLIVPILISAWRRRSNYLWIFTLAWGVPVAISGVRVLAAFRVIPWSAWVDDSTLFAMAMEAVLTSLCIAYRIRLLSLERDAAREQEIAARLLAATDPLTGLLNRRAFLDNAIGRNDDQQLILIDLDHFKSVNETIGHDGGDEVLRVVARALRTATTPEALVARVGGEEFAILVPAEAPLDARKVLDRLRAERMPFDLTVTASVGTCVGPLTRETEWKALYRHADRALFEAKAAGRDRVRDGGALAYAA